MSTRTTPRTSTSSLRSRTPTRTGWWSTLFSTEPVPGGAVSVRVVDFWSDIGCPWASLAVHRFRAARSALGLDGQVVLRHRAFPLELINGQGTPKGTLD